MFKEKKDQKRKNGVDLRMIYLKKLSKYWSWYEFSFQFTLFLKI